MLKYVYDVLFITPLRRLYEFGPQFGGFGFWGGRSHAEICASVTLYSEVFWQDHINDCSFIVDNKFNALRVTIESISHFIGLLIILNLLLTTIRTYVCPRDRGGRDGRDGRVLYIQHVD